MGAHQHRGSERNPLVLPIAMAMLRSCRVWPCFAYVHSSLVFVLLLVIFLPAVFKCYSCLHSRSGGHFSLNTREVSMESESVFVRSDALPDVEPVPPDLLPDVESNRPDDQSVSEMMMLEELRENLEIDIGQLDFGFIEDNAPRAESSTLLDNARAESPSREMRASDSSITVRGMRDVPEPTLASAGRGKEKLKSESNDRWSLRRADQLRQALGWDMSIPFGDLPLSQVDELLSNLFSRVVKMDGAQYPGSSLVNMMNGYNRILRRSSDLRILNGIPGEIVEPHFNIKRHRAFMKTRLVLNAAIKKGGREGINKKPRKVNFISEEMEGAVLNDIDHSVLTNTGVQKRLALYLMLRIGVRGGLELWQLQRCDLRIETDNLGREYVQFEERESKQNQWGVNRCQEHQFRNVFHSYEPDFVFTVKQYYRHLPPLEEGVAPDLFTATITNPVGNIWFNRKSKVSQHRSSQWLSNMLGLVGLPKDLFTNKSGRTALITRMAVEGVPDLVGMMVSGHHTQDGYSRYDRTQHLKQEAAVLVVSRPGLTYENALAEVTEVFRREKVVGNLGNLKPLIAPSSLTQPARASASSSSPMQLARASSSSGTGIQLPSTALSNEGSSVTEEEPQIRVPVPLPVPQSEKDVQMDVLKLNSDARTLAKWHENYDSIDWEDAARNNPLIAFALASQKAPQVTYGQNMAGNFSNCTFHIHSSVPSFSAITEGIKENILPRKADP